MGKTADLTGQRFGKLTAVEKTNKYSCGYTVWRCVCDCGNEVFVASRNLKNQNTTSCGCGRAARYTDITGQRFGMLTAGSLVGRNKNGQTLWLCRCDCGGEVVTTYGQLRAGYRKSCGCLSRPPLKKWIGRKFGDLTVIAYDGRRNGKHYWKCLCSCGNTIAVCQSNLKGGHTTSCGCKADIKNNIHFVDGTCVEQIRSRRVSRSNTSGIRGVYYSPREDRWKAQITFKGKTKYLGSYRNIEDAAKARYAAEEIFDDFLKEYDKKQTEEARAAI